MTTNNQEESQQSAAQESDLQTAEAEAIIEEEELPENPSEEEFSIRLENPDISPAQQKSDTEKDKIIADLEEKLLRSAAEMQNIRNRTQKEVDDTRKFSISGFAKDLIGVLENLRRAQDSIKDENLEENQPLKMFNEGITLTADELISVFAKNGIERIDPLGEDFDHNFHQALMQIPTDEFEAGKVAQVMVAGYKIKDRLLRPAMVGVAQALPTEAAEADKPKSDSSEQEAS